MHEPWFYCPELRTGELTLDATEGRHAAQVLRLRAGDALMLFDGCGQLARATAIEPHATGPMRRPNRPSPELHVNVPADGIQWIPAPARTLALLVAGCKGERLDWLVEKCTELGASRIVLMEFERSVVHTGPQHVERLQRTAITACKQCRRAWLPQIQAGQTLDSVVSQHGFSRLLIAEPADDAPLLSTGLARQESDTGALAIVIGPEGGLSAAELAFLRDAGGQMVRLAEHILRVETAAIAATAIWAAH